MDTTMSNIQSDRFSLLELDDGPTRPTRESLNYTSHADTLRSRQSEARAVFTLIHQLGEYSQAYSHRAAKSVKCLVWTLGYLQDRYRANRRRNESAIACGLGLAMYHAARCPRHAPGSLEAMADNEGQLLAVGQFSDVGCIYNGDCGPATTMATPSEVAERHGVKPPNSKRLGYYFGKAVSAESCADIRTIKVSGEATYKIQEVNPEAQTGESAGSVVLRLSLNSEGKLDMQDGGDFAMFARITERFDAMVADEVLSSADVTKWVRTVLCRDFGAVRTKYGYHVPRSNVEGANAFCRDLGSIWGTWGKGLAVMTGGEMLDQIANGLADEVSAELDGLAAQRKAARKAGRDDIGVRAASNAISRLDKIAERTKAYAQIIGPARVDAIRRHAMELIEELRPLVSDTAQRGALIWDEISRDRDGGAR
jgi:hypothetical protein